MDEKSFAALLSKALRGIDHPEIVVVEDLRNERGSASFDLVRIEFANGGEGFIGVHHQGVGS
ncbi:hypothetical protein GCM10022243_24060 [Saccharothrix violaceirubra]|uniref:Uncharacterized protein n=1 Tax=Saccharothrix violaceirubra TaxID=413306 RepID=A0A7W7T7A0_9PSEU|nr:hypothetical protein [Saccharothrix violaceirubra]MBB4967851.1 hypothetical protein [Saccharothrix violaceirubra]